MSSTSKLDTAGIARVAVNRDKNVDREHIVDVTKHNLVSDVSFVLMAFKCCVEEDDHIINKFAAWFTGNKSRRRTFVDEEDEEKKFRGLISHVEILIKQRRIGETEDAGDWYRYSIMKKIGRRAADGQVTFTPGKVHSIKTGYVNGKMQVKNYRFYRLDLGVDGVNRALAFLDRQVVQKAGFNKIGYYLNFVSPMLFGVCHYKQAERKTENKWFCTELIICALQAAGMATFALRKACAISPNEMFDIIAGVEARHVWSAHYF